MVLKKLSRGSRIGTKIKPGAGRVGIWACTWGSAPSKDGTSRVGRMQLGRVVRKKVRGRVR